MALITNLLKSFDNLLETGNSAKISKPYHQVENETAIDASSTTNDSTPAITAFLIFCGEFSECAFNSGRKTKKEKSGHLL